MIKIKRIYDEVSEDDGRRILVDRLWPRGVSKEKAKIDQWLKEVSPSAELRKWFGHEPAKWPEFLKRYTAELATQKTLLEELVREGRASTITLVYSAKDEERNQAVALLEVLKGLGKF